MRYRLLVLAAALLTGGCGLLEPAAAGDAPTAPPSPTTKAPSPTTKADPTAKPGPASEAGGAESGLGAVKDSGDLPDPCTLLTEAQVTDLTGRGVTRVDEDGGGPGDVTRFCQWQQPSGQLAVFLTRTTPAEFEVTVAEAEPVTGVGENAHWHSGHLYVLFGTVQIDVYSRGNSEAGNRADAKQVATTIIPGL